MVGCNFVWCGVPKCGTVRGRRRSKKAAGQIIRRCNSGHGLHKKCLITDPTPSPASPKIMFVLEKSNRRKPPQPILCTTVTTSCGVLFKAGVLFSIENAKFWPILSQILLVPWLHIVKTVYKRIFACKLTNNICVIILVRCRGPHLLFATRLHTSYLGWCRESAEGPAT